MMLKQNFHNVTKMTPADAMKPSNTAQVKFNLELKKNVAECIQMYLLVILFLFIAKRIG